MPRKGPRVSEPMLRILQSLVEGHGNLYARKDWNPAGGNAWVGGPRGGFPVHLNIIYSLEERGWVKENKTAPHAEAEEYVITPEGKKEFESRWRFVSSKAAKTADREPIQSGVSN